MSVNVFKSRAAAVIASALLSLGVASAALGAEHASSQRIEVDLADYRFSPATIEVIAGKPVELVLTDRDILTPHNLTLVAPAAGIDVNVDLQPGKTVSVSFTPTEPGTYQFYCDKKLLFFKSHREQGMEGKLVVKAR